MCLIRSVFFTSLASPLLYDEDEEGADRRKLVLSHLGRYVVMPVAISKRREGRGASGCSVA